MKLTHKNRYENYKSKLALEVNIRNYIRNIIIIISILCMCELKYMKEEV